MLWNWYLAKYKQKHPNSRESPGLMFTKTIKIKKNQRISFKKIIIFVNFSLYQNNYFINEMTDISNEENLEFSNTRRIEDHDLYRYIPPPIPLIPKNKYSDDLPRSYFLML